MTINDFLIGVGAFLFLLAWVSGVFLFGYYVLLMKNLHDLSDIQQTNPELYHEMKSKFKLHFPRLAEPAHLKGDFAWRLMLNEKFIVQLDRADELRNHSAFIKRKKIIGRIVFLLKTLVVSFVGAMSLFSYTGKF